MAFVAASSDILIGMVHECCCRASEEAHPAPTPKATTTLEAPKARLNPYQRRCALSHKPASRRNPTAVDCNEPAGSAPTLVPPLPSGPPSSAPRRGAHQAGMHTLRSMGTPQPHNQCLSLDRTKLHPASTRKVAGQVGKPQQRCSRAARSSLVPAESTAKVWWCAIMCA